jgi:hypothetical protein
MKIKAKLFGLITAYTALVSQAFALNETRFALSPNPSESRDHLVIPFPDSKESIGDGLTLFVKRSTDLENWGTIDMIHFELSFDGEIQGFLLDYSLQLNEEGNGLEVAVVKVKSIMASSFSSVLNNEALSYVSDETNEIFVFIGNYAISEVQSEPFTLQMLEYTERSPVGFFQMEQTSIVIE